MIRRDVVQQLDRQNNINTTKSLAWLGVDILRTSRRSNQIDASNVTTRLADGQSWVTKVVPSSPAAQAGIQALQLCPQNATLIAGEAIVNIAGNSVTSWADLDMDNRRVGEQVALTLENIQGERRVVYVTLSRRPKASI